MNTTFSNSHLQKEHQCFIEVSTIIHVITAGCIIVVSIIGNGLVLYVFRHQKRCKKYNYEILIWYLSFFDLAASVISLNEIYENLTCYRNWPFGNIGCKAIYSFYHVSYNTSICILTIISIDRYRCIVTPFKKKFTSTSIKIFILVSVAISFSLQWHQIKALEVRHKHDNFACYQNKEDKFYTVPRLATVILRDLMFILVFGVSTLHISNTLHEQYRRNAFYKFRNRKNCSYNRGVFKMLFVIAATFILLVLPYDLWDCAMLISRILPTDYKIHMK